MQRKKLIVNADDYGFTRGISKGILLAHRYGIVTSTSLMVNTRGAQWAAKKAAKYTSLSLGLHGVLSLSTPKENNVDFHINQLENQLKKFIQLTHKHPTHFDLHGVPKATPAMKLAAYSFVQRHRLPFRGMKNSTVVNNFYGMSGANPLPHRITLEALSKILKCLSPGISILVCHPGITSNRLKDPYRTLRRIELDVLTSPQISSLIQKEGIKLINFLGEVTIHAAKETT